MLDLATSSPADNILDKPTYPLEISKKCKREEPSELIEAKYSINKIDRSKRSPNPSEAISGNRNPTSPSESLISKALTDTCTTLPFMNPAEPSSVDSDPKNISQLTNKMNDDILSPSMAAAKVLGVAMATSKPLPSSSSPSSLKLLPKKFSPFSVDSLLSHKEKLQGRDQDTENNEFRENSIDSKTFEDKKSSRIPEHLASSLSALTSSVPQDLRSTRLSQDSTELGHHLSVAKFLLNNNLHERTGSDNVSRHRFSNLENSSESKPKYEERKDSKNLDLHDSIELQKRLQKQEQANMNVENGSSNENDIDVCGDEADMEDDDHEYHDDMNEIKSESNYQHMMSDEDVSGEEDNEHNDFVKTEDMDDEKLEFERQLHYSSSDHKLDSRSDLSPKQNPLLSPRFPLGFPITSASPNPFSPPSPSSGIAGSTLPRPTPSLPWLPQLRSPLHLPGFIGSKSD